MRDCRAPHVAVELRMLRPAASRARNSQVSTTVSGLSEMLSMPSSTSHLREVGMIRRPLPADADVLAGLAAGLDRHVQHVP